MAIRSILLVLLSNGTPNYTQNALASHEARFIKINRERVLELQELFFVLCLPDNVRTKILALFACKSNYPSHSIQPVCSK